MSKLLNNIPLQATIAVSLAVLVCATKGFSKLEGGSLGEPCQDNETCIATVNFSFCLKDAINDPFQDGVCSCLPTHLEYTPKGAGCNGDIPPNKICIFKLTTRLHNCEVDEQCIHGSFGPQSFCNDQNKCQCPAGTVFSSKIRDVKCLTLASKITDDCEEHHQCGPIANSFCDIENVPNVCRCQPGWVSPSGQSGICNPLAKQLGESCDLHENQCSNLTNAWCDVTKNKTCQCLPDTWPSAARDKCLKVSYPCEISEQCQVNEYCGITGYADYKNCMCLPGYTRLGSFACEKLGTFVGDECQTHCRIGPTAAASSKHCSSNGTCQCLPEEIVYNGKCYPPSRYSENCVINEQCPIEQYCVYYQIFDTYPINSKVCRCAPDHVYVPPFNGEESHCRRKNKVNEICPEKYECDVGDCDPVSNTCVCSDYMQGASEIRRVPSADLSSCLRTGRYLGYTCTEASECGGLGTFCKDGKCACLPGFGEKNMDFRRVKLLAALLQRPILFTSY